MLESLVARAGESARVADWRAEALRGIAGETASLPSVGAAVLHAASGAQPADWAWVCIATPIHLRAGMSNVTLPQDGILAMAPGEAEALATDFNRVFGGADLQLSVSRSGELLYLSREPLQVATHDPEVVAGRDVFDFQPAGPAGPRLRRLMSEMEMWLFDHAVNRFRAAGAVPPITGLWLWGGGAAGEPGPSVRGWTAGRDPLFAAFGSETGFPREAGPGVVVCGELPGSTEWPQVEERWLAPAASALRSGRIERLDLSAGRRRFSIPSGPRWRFWRRTRPWWESFEANDREPDGI